MTTNYTVQEEQRSSVQHTTRQSPVTYQTLDRSRLWWAGLAAAVVAAVANGIVFWLATVSFGLPLYVAPVPDLNPAPLSLVAVIITSVIPALIAAGLLALLARWVRRPWHWFWSIALVVLLLSLGGPLSATADPITKIVLGIMHLVAAVAIVGTLTALARSPQRQEGTKRGRA